MRFSTLEIRWHDTKPIFSCDFQPFECVQHKRQLNPYQRTAGNVSDGDGKLWRVATAGGDTNVRIWLAIPNPPVASTSSATTTSSHSLHNTKDVLKTPGSGAGASNDHAGAASTSEAGQPAYGKPKVEYLATLDKHNLTVNVVRFSPSGHLLATAGDDSGTGGILLWRLSANAATTAFGGSYEDAAYEKEAWQAIKVIKSRSPEIYDMVWSPDGQYILAGGTDGAARIHRVTDGACVAEMTDHKDWVQGVAWDPLNKFIATQGKDRQMMVYSLEEIQDGVKVKLLSKNARLTSIDSSDSPIDTAGTQVHATGSAGIATTPAASTSTSTMPSTSSQIMYGDEESTPFFRRLAFSSDGALLVTPAGQYEDPSASSRKGKKPASTSTHAADADASVVISSSSPVVEKKPASNSKSVNGGMTLANGKLKKSHSGPSPTSYVFARGQLVNETPIAHLPGHRTTSVVVKFNPVIWDLRKKKSDLKGKGKEEVETTSAELDTAAEEGSMHVDETSGSGLEPSSRPETSNPATVLGSVPTSAPVATEPSTSASGPNSALPSSQFNNGSTEPILNTKDEDIPANGIFKLKQRTIYALATHETILIYDTQQETPICMFGSLHFAAFTDLAWTADGLTLIATSSDGYASIFTFEEGELGVPSSEQPVRSPGPLEDALANGSSLSSPSKTAISQSNGDSNPSTSTLLGSIGNTLVNTAPNVFGAQGGEYEDGRPAKNLQSGAALAREESDDVICLSSVPISSSATARVSSNAEPISMNTTDEGNSGEPKKVKKRAALTHIGPLGS